MGMNADLSYVCNASKKTKTIPVGMWIHTKVLLPGSYRLDTTIILQGHHRQGSLCENVRCWSPRARQRHATRLGVPISTLRPEQNRSCEPAAGPPPHNWRRRQETTIKLDRRAKNTIKQDVKKRTQVRFPTPNRHRTATVRAAASRMVYMSPRSKKSN